MYSHEAFLDRESQETQQISAFPGLYHCLAVVIFLVKRELGCLAESSSALLNWAGEGLFPCVDEEMFLEVLFASKVLETDLAGVGPDIQVRDVDMPAKVELG